MDRKQRSQVTTGVLLIALGLIFLGQRLDLFPHLALQRLWPVFLVILGAARFLAPSEEGRRGGGAWMIFIGVLFLLHTYEIFRLSDSWPLFIVAGGVSILFGRSHVRVGTREQRRDDRRADGGGTQTGIAPAEGDANGH